MPSLLLVIVTYYFRLENNEMGRLKLLKTQIRSIIGQNYNWIFLAAFFFFLGIVFSLFSLGGNQFFLTNLTASQQEILQQMAELIFNSHPLVGVAFLFINNLFASMYVVLLGVILGLPPLLALFTNGAFLGTILASLGHGGISALGFFFLGVLPHGLFELPAFFLAAAFGLKLGYHVIFPLPQKRRGESFIFIWKEFLSILPFVLILLITAAAVEIFITPHLLNLVEVPAVY